ncbi:hypothetical protein [Streptomyces sp. NPDC059176]|uniref:hypothetical protein n=1 Tax=unclassified Streptomyces TaxID=2593676 RepID=UPI003692AB2E
MSLFFASNPAQADTPDPVNWPKPRFVTYNVCGASCDIYAGSKTAWRDSITGAMDYWEADLVMLQEMCYGQWQLLRDSLQGRSSGNRYDSVWGATLASTDGCGKWGTDKRYGLATFAKGGPGTITPSLWPSTRAHAHSARTERSRAESGWRLRSVAGRRRSA